MINPFKKKIKNKSSGFSFANIVSFECLIKGMRIEKKIIKAKIVGKVKNANAYVIIVFGLPYYYPAELCNERQNIMLSLKRKYGYPVRQIELEWGKFSGSAGEFILPEHELKKVE